MVIWDYDSSVDEKPSGVIWDYDTPAEPQQKLSPVQSFVSAPVGNTVNKFMNPFGSSSVTQNKNIPSFLRTQPDMQSMQTANLYPENIQNQINPVRNWLDPQQAMEGIGQTIKATGLDKWPADIERIINADWSQYGNVTPEETKQIERQKRLSKVIETPLTAVANFAPYAVINPWTAVGILGQLALGQLAPQEEKAQTYEYLYTSPMPIAGDDPVKRTENITDLLTNKLTEKGGPGWWVNYVAPAISATGGIIAEATTDPKNILLDKLAPVGDALVQKGIRAEMKFRSGFVNRAAKKAESMMYHNPAKAKEILDTVVMAKQKGLNPEEAVKILSDYGKKRINPLMNKSITRLEDMAVKGNKGAFEKGRDKMINMMATWEEYLPVETINRLKGMEEVITQKIAQKQKDEIFKKGESAVNKWWQTVKGMGEKQPVPEPLGLPAPGETFQRPRFYAGEQGISEGMPPLPEKQPSYRDFAGEEPPNLNITSEVKNPEVIKMPSQKNSKASRR